MRKYLLEQRRRLRTVFMCSGLAVVLLTFAIGVFHAPPVIWGVIGGSAFLFGNAFSQLEDIERKLARLPPE